MKANVSYGIVLAGFAGKAGSYQLDIQAVGGDSVQGMTPMVLWGSTWVGANVPPENGVGYTS